MRSRLTALCAAWAMLAGPLASAQSAGDAAPDNLAPSGAGMATPAASLPPGFPAPLQRALAEAGLPASALSLWVQAVDSPMPRLTLHADIPRQMASVMKLLTTGVALRTLGPAWRWQTAAALRGRLDSQGVLHGDVHLRASGDPSMDAMRLAAALRGWREAGLREIRGDVVVDRGVFALLTHDPAAFDGQPLRPYNAGPDAWLLGHQAVSLRLRLDPARPGRALVALSPALDGVRLDAQVRLDPRAPCGDWREALSLEIGPAPAGRPLDGRRTLRLRGSYPLACQDQAWPLRWPQAQEGEHSARLFTAAWAEAGGHLRGQVREGPWPLDATPWVDWWSPPLAEVVRDINKFSNNVMARQLFLTLGLPGEGLPATLAHARVVVADHVRAATLAPGQGGPGPCDGDALALDNGSGLSRQELATTRCLARWVQAMWADPAMPEWLASLPVAGVDGTARRLQAATGRAHLKTGSLDGVASLAGVVQDDGGRRWVVVAVLNDPRAGQARGVLQAVVNWAASGDNPRP